MRAGSVSYLSSISFIAMALIMTSCDMSYNMTGVQIRVDEQVVVDNDPAVDDNEPTVDGNDPAVDGNEPTVDGNNPAVDDNDPAVDDNDPAVDDNDPTVDDNDPTVDDNDPTVDDNNPTVDDNDPTVDDNDPTVDDNDPTVNETGFEYDCTESLISSDSGYGNYTEGGGCINGRVVMELQDHLGDLMTALEDCAARGLRLPTYHELSAAGNYVQELGMSEGNYWAYSVGGGFIGENCYMPDGNCGTHNTNEVQWYRCVW